MENKTTEFKCIYCGGNIITKIGPAMGYWGNTRVVVENIEKQKCLDCGFTQYDLEQAIKLEEAAKAEAEKNNDKSENC